ncbi:hypothetical protein AVEN_81576-1 [Araneus ventricosus]|uniref:DDE-1 domain-containing protein n=1 Tax=Araneus ventricosus TaxID=182803 RepID=A0A4Y2FMQ0_ARAVE|nr:hypothetical protein AVEN_81576-1 [Araneus ventricosus]
MRTSYLFLPHPPSCRKFQSSPRPSTFCLSIGYFLSDSEALALPKCRTFIFVMEPNERKRVLLTVEQKFQIASRIEAGETLTKLPKEFGVGDDDEEEAACSVVQFWKALTLKDRVYMINEAWESVPEHTLKRFWRKVAPYLENVDQSNDSDSVTVTELNGLLKQIPSSGNCEKDDVSSWLDCDAEDAGFQLMSDGEIIA